METPAREKLIRFQMSVPDEEQVFYSKLFFSK
jgi:hypothetical protein